MWVDAAMVADHEGRKEVLIGTAGFKLQAVGQQIGQKKLKMVGRAGRP